MQSVLPIGLCAPGVTCGVSISTCGLLVYGTLLVSCILWAMYFSHLQQYGSGVVQHHVPVVVLKLPRSGSTWFTDTMNKYDNIFLSKEIVQRSDGSKYPASTVEDHFINALKKPMGKLSSTDNVVPSGRFMEDYIFHSSMKPFREMDVIGFTLNPEHSEGIDWDRIAKNVPKFKVVVLGRSNLVKSAISGYTGAAIKSECGSSNLRASGDCDPKIDVPWTTAELASEVRQWQTRYDAFDLSVQNHPALSSRVVHHMYYEELQEDPTGAMRRLFSALEMPVEYPIKPLRDSEWRKRSSEDLSQVLTNYDSIRDAFQRGSCTCLLDMLLAVQPITFAERCNEVWRDSDRKCQSLSGNHAATLSQVSLQHEQDTKGE
jgi:hypothetical protein